MSTIWFSLLDSDKKDSKELPFYPTKKYVQPLLGKPVEIGFFSIDAKRSVHFDKTQLKYLVTPLKMKNLCLDLNLNFHVDVHNYNFITIKRMHHTLHWLMNNKEYCPSYRINSKNKFDFITTRGTLKHITCTPYLKGWCREQWEICASKLEGVIYFSAIDSEVDIEENQNLTPRQKRYQAWGYKFEQLMTTDTIDGKSNTESKTFQLEEYCIVLKNVLDKFSLLYVAEIDAAVPYRQPGPGSGNTSCYTELKTSRQFVNDTQKYCHYRYKVMTWWAQSIFAGLPEIICGMRDDNGIVNELEVISVNKIPEKCVGMWSSEACLSFCVKFLNFLKKTVMEDDPNVVYKFHYNAGDTIHCTKLINPIEKYRIIPDWYMKGKKQV